MRGPYTPLAVANEFIIRSSKGLDHLKLQKLVYYAQGYALANGFGLTREQPEVWKYGPVFRDMYFDLKYHGDEKIRSPEKIGLTSHAPFMNADDFRRLEVVEDVWRRLKRYKGVELSEFTHEDGTPWSDVVARYNNLVPRGTKIPSAAMAAYFADNEK